MFDNVGKGNSETTKRQAGSLLASILVNGGLLLGLAWLGSEVVEETLEDEPVEITLFESAPPPPPPPPPPPGGGKKPKKTKPKEEKPKEVEPEPEEVEPDPEQIEEPEEEPEPEEIPEDS